MVKVGSQEAVGSQEVVKSEPAAKKRKVSKDSKDSGSKASPPAGKQPAQSVPATAAAGGSSSSSSSSSAKVKQEANADTQKVDASGTVAGRYQKLTLQEHVLTRPDAYVGSTLAERTSNMYFVNESAVGPDGGKGEP